LTVLLDGVKLVAINRKYRRNLCLFK